MRALKYGTYSVLANTTKPTRRGRNPPQILIFSVSKVSKGQITLEHKIEPCFHQGKEWGKSPNALPTAWRLDALGDCLLCFQFRTFQQESSSPILSRQVLSQEAACVQARPHITYQKYIHICPGPIGYEPSNGKKALLHLDARTRQANTLTTASGRVADRQQIQANAKIS